MKNPPLLLLRAIRRAQPSGATCDLIQPDAGAQLPGPIFSLALKRGDVLDPTDLSAGGMTVKVAVNSLSYVGGKARLHWEGYSISPPLELPITALGELSFWVDKARYVDPNLDGSVHVWYELIPPTGTTAVSESLLISVQDATSETWPAPEIHDHTGSPVTSWSPVKPGTTQANIARFVLRDARLKVNDAVAPLWLFSNGASLGVDIIIVTTAGEVRAEIPAAVLAESLSKTVQVSYLPILAGVPGSLSEALNLQVLTFTSGQLVPPNIVEAVVDLNRFAGDATVLATPWPLIALGQLYWLHASATLDDGTQHVETLANAQAVNADQVSVGLRIRLSRGFLLRLENATQLTLQLKVAFAANAAEGEAIMFPASDVNVVQLALTLPAPTVTGVVDGRLDPTDIPAEGVKITAAYTGIAVDQWVSAQWVGVTAALSQDFPAVRVTNANTPVEFVVAKAKVEASLFKAVSVVYKVARTQGAEAKTSEALPFEVERPKGGFEDFERFPLGPVPEVILDGMTITKAWRNVTLTVSDLVEESGIAGKCLEVIAPHGSYPGIYFTPFAPASRVAIKIVDKGWNQRSLVTFDDGSTVAGGFVVGENIFQDQTDSSLKIVEIRLYEMQTSQAQFYVSELHWSS